MYPYPSPSLPCTLNSVRCVSLTVPPVVPPCAVQKPEDGVSRLKRVVLIGDHHQLPPVVKNQAFQKYSHLDQSLFTRFIRLGTPYVQLNAQVGGEAGANTHSALAANPTAASTCTV